MLHAHCGTIAVDGRKGLLGDRGDGGHRSGDGAGAGSRSARVIGVGRSRERCAQAARLIHEQSRFQAPPYLVADLSSQVEIRRLADEVKALTSRLDVLLNNAGGLFLSRQETVDGLEMTFALNHMAYFLLTNLLLDLVKATTAARVVSVASEAHQSGTIEFDDLQARSNYSFWRAYRQSKLANILFTRELAGRLEGSGVTANCLHPGYVNTGIFQVEGVRGWLLRRLAERAGHPACGARKRRFTWRPHLRSRTRRVCTSWISVPPPLLPPHATMRWRGGSGKRAQCFAVWRSRRPRERALWLGQAHASLLIGRLLDHPGRPILS